MNWEMVTEGVVVALARREIGVVMWDGDGGREEGVRGKSGGEENSV